MSVLGNALKRGALCAKGLVLLTLLSHAFLASATHFHRVVGAGYSDDSGASLSRREEQRRNPLANGDEQCLVCRLQSNFSPGLMRHAAPELTPPAAKQAGLASRGHTPAQGAFTFSTPGRAPPIS